MCSPAIALVAVTVASAAASAYSQNQQAKYTSAVAEKNADIAESQAQDSINRGNAQADEIRRRNRQAAGTQTAMMGATGAELSTGNALDIFGDTAQFGTLDAMTTVNNAQREAYGYQVQSANYGAQAVSARKQGNMGAMTTLLTTPLQAYGAYQMAGGTWSPFSQKAAPISAAVGTPTGR
ncbi:TPA: virion core protein, T7 gp14 family [Enterobacter ludwigii]